MNIQSSFENILNIFPEKLKMCFYYLSEQEINSIIEIRITSNNPVVVDTVFDTSYICNSGFTKSPKNAFRGDKQLVCDILNLISNNSLYAYDTQLKGGFITLKGGHRVGVIGTAVYENKKIKTIKNISSLCIRIAKSVDMVSKDFISSIISANGNVKNTAVIGKPKSGKTTLIRSLAQYLSTPEKINKIIKVGIIDERMEIASVYNGECMFDVGVNSFVLNGASKSDGVDVMVRGFSPDVIIMDEVWSDEDKKAVDKAIGAGCSVIFTRHGTQKDISKIFETMPVEQAVYLEKANMGHKMTYYNKQ